ncbi:MAG: hypothetical protein IJS28_00895 [Synergistaceae bacterium]|nr:hypothetical protein [Synergistaceae bacterium]
MKIDAVILAKSSMWGNYCVAGIDIHSGMWVRFVSYGDGDPLDDSQMMFINDSGSCVPLDVARIRVAKRLPRHNHMEDCMIERDAWLRLGRMSIQDVLRIHEDEEYRYIFGNAREYLSEEEMMHLRHRYSLILVKAEGLTLHTERNRKGELKTRAAFTHHGREYTHIRVTDPEYELKTERANVKIGDAYLVMSMPVKPFNGRYYKLIAKILPEKQ